MPNLRLYNGTFASTDEQKAEALNRQFASVFTNEDMDHLPEPANLEVHTPLETILITDDMVLNKLKSLRADKSPGPDGVHPYILKHLANSLTMPLAIIYNCTLTTGILPQIWKTGTVTAIFKKGDKSLPQNYRPISLTCIICKILESIITDHITAHLKINNLENLHQHGFTKGKSTVTNLVQALNIWTEALSHGLPVDVIYLDFEKAFDKVPHQRLINQLRSHGRYFNGYGISFTTANRK
jgi:hypothetical protein